LIPEISSLSGGSTSVVGGIVVRQKSPELNFKPEGVELSSYECVIENITSELEEVEGNHRGFLIDSGLCARNIQVEINDQLEEIKL